MNWPIQGFNMFQSTGATRAKLDLGIKPSATLYVGASCSSASIAGATWVACATQVSGDLLLPQEEEDSKWDDQQS